MTNIDRLLQSTAAGQMAKKLDEADGNSDGMIKGSIWNQFVQGTGGKEINENGSISIANAMKSITTYIVKNMRAQNKTESEIVEEYNTKINNLNGGTSQTDGADEAEGAANEDGDDGAAATGGSEGATKKSPKTTEQAIKVTVPPAYISKAAKSTIANKNQGLKLRASLKKGDLRGVNNDNVAWATWGVSYGPNTQKQAIKVYALLKKQYESYWPDDKKPYVREFMKMSYIQQNDIINEMADAVRKADNFEIKDAAKDKAYHNANRKKIQQSFDNANKALIDAANNKGSLKIENNNDGKSATLPDGRWIRVYYDKDGEICKIDISHDKTPNHKKEDGTTYDGAEISYRKDMALYHIDNSNNKYQGSITSGYDFEKLKAIAESIFGKNK